MTDAWICAAYDTVALAGVVLAMYVMQMTERDRINRVDPAVLQWIRRLSFVVLALVLCYSVTADWQRSIPICLLVGAGVLNLGVNAAALRMRVRGAAGRGGSRQLLPGQARGSKSRG